jgi:hypothetical protein
MLKYRQICPDVATYTQIEEANSHKQIHNWLEINKYLLSVPIRYTVSILVDGVIVPGYRHNDKG